MKHRKVKLDTTPDIQYPAIAMMHWPTGPVPVCRYHGLGLLKLGEYLGTFVVATKLDKPTECTNCVNEAKNATPND